MDKPTQREFDTSDRHTVRTEEAFRKQRVFAEKIVCSCKACVKVAAYDANRTAPLTVVEVSHA